MATSAGRPPRLGAVRRPTRAATSESPTSGGAAPPHAASSAPPRRPRPSSTARASSTSATGSRCCSTRARSSRTAATPTRWPPGLPADGVVTGRGTVDGRPAIVIANDPTVKAGSWGARTVEKIVRATETALREELPVFWFVDSAGARITDQVEMFPGRRGAGRIFHNQVALSGKVPQICCLFGPSRRRRRLHPDVLRPRHHGRGQRLDVPRQPADGRDGRRREGLARGDGRRPDALHRLRAAATCSPPTTPRPSSWPGSTSPTCPRSWRDEPPSYAPEEPAAPLTREHRARAREPAVRHPRGHRRARRRRARSSRSSRCSPPSSSSGFGRMDGETVGIVANNSAVKGGVLFTDTADKAARFIWLCDAFNDPAGLPRRRAGLHDRLRGRARRHHPARRQDGHRRRRRRPCRSSASSSARPTAPGSTRWAGPGFGPDATHRAADRPDRRDGPGGRRQRGLRQQDRRDRATRTSGTRSSQDRRREYEEDVDLERLAADLVLDAIIEADELRAELLHRLRYAARRDRAFSTRRHGVPPV